jgi:hypothetical protein
VARSGRFPVSVSNAAARRRIAAALTTASALFVLLTACSGSDGAATPSENNGNNGNGNRAGGAAFTAYRDCLSKNGVTLPSVNARPSGQPRTRPSGGARPSGFPDGVRPSGGPGGGRGFGMQKPAGVDDATWQKARAACASVLPSGRPNFSRGPGGQGGPGGADGAYQNCLNDHGGAQAADAKKACVVLSPTPAG